MTPRDDAYRSYASFACNVSCILSVLWTYTKLCDEWWSTNTVAYRYLSFVRKPRICPMSPGVVDCSWSTDTQSPASLITGSFRFPVDAFVRHGRRVALPIWQLGQSGKCILRNLLGSSPFSLIFSILEYGRCASLTCHCKNSSFVCLSLSETSVDPYCLDTLRPSSNVTARGRFVIGPSFGSLLGTLAVST